MNRSEQETQYFNNSALEIKFFKSFSKLEKFLENTLLKTEERKLYSNMKLSDNEINDDKT